QRHINIDSAAFADLERGLAEVRDVVQALLPTEGHVVFDETVRTLSNKIDRLEANTHKPVAYERLEGAILALQSIMSQVASNDALAILSDEVRALAAKVEQTPSTGLIANIEQRIASLVDALQAQNQAIEDTR